MRLNELLIYNDIVIQCHDNPDADALASGYALWWYFKQNGRDAKFIYRGRNMIQKSNLLIMLDDLEVPVAYEPNFAREPELLVTVDCQYGQRNVTTTKAQNLAVIDHHQVTVDLPELSEVRSNIGSCSTIIWDMIKAEGLDIKDEKLLSTALYYGLYTDTNRLSEVSHPLDRDLMDSLVINKSLVLKMSNSNISLNELKITGKAIFDYEYRTENRLLILKADQCDPNILGVISDFSMETTEVDVCLAYYVSPSEIKFSVRSCVREVHANELAEFLAKDIGGGGGHMTKAGGTVRPEKLELLCGAENGSEESGSADLHTLAHDTFSARMDEYFEKYEIIYARETTLDTSDMKVYEKRPVNCGYVNLTELYPVGTRVNIRTLEGDVDVTIEDDKCLMIGVEGEIYPITRTKLYASYEVTEEPYEASFEYAPCIINSLTAEKKEVLSFAKVAVSTAKVSIHARPLKGYVKLFTAWDDEKYYTGTPGDYIAVRGDDAHDIYIIKGSLFDRLYREVRL